MPPLPAEGYSGLVQLPSSLHGHPASCSHEVVTRLRSHVVLVHPVIADIGGLVDERGLSACRE